MGKFSSSMTVLQTDSRMLHAARIASRGSFSILFRALSNSALIADKSLALISSDKLLDGAAEPFVM
jgi:hypothetical protein